MHTASYEFLMKLKESVGCHQTLSAQVGGLGMRLCIIRHNVPLQTKDCFFSLSKPSAHTLIRISAGTLGDGFAPYWLIAAQFECGDFK